LLFLSLSDKSHVESIQRCKQPAQQHRKW